MPASYPRIPYGWADLRAIRLENRLYIDKTRFIHALEEERYAFLIRPRRMGKSCWVSLLAATLREAAQQVRGYLADPGLQRRYPSVQHIGLAMVFHGWEMAAYEAVGDDAEAAAPCKGEANS